MCSRNVVDTYRRCTPSLVIFLPWTRSRTTGDLFINIIVSRILRCTVAGGYFRPRTVELCQAICFNPEELRSLLQQGH